MHGGTVEARSEGPGRGSEFVVRLPLARRAGRRRAAAPTRPGAGAAGSPPRAGGGRQPGRRGEPGSCFCSSGGTRSRAPTTDRRRLAAAAEFRPEVVLLDIGLPGMSGYEVARQLRAATRFPGRVHRGASPATARTATAPRPGGGFRPSPGQARAARSPAGADRLGSPGSRWMLDPRERLEMENRKIGSLDVSVVGLGCNNFGGRLDADAHGARSCDAALDAGINFFDTADIYGGTQSEEYPRPGARRAAATRSCSPPSSAMKIDEQRQGAKPDYVRQALRGQPAPAGAPIASTSTSSTCPTPTTPIADTLGALDELVRAGKVREIGCSNFSVEQLREAEAAVAAGRRALRQRAERIQPPAPRAGAGRRPRRVRARRPRLPALLPARQRAAHRQVPPGPAAAGGHAALAGRRSPRFLNDRTWRSSRRSSSFADVARPHAAGARLLLAAGPPAGRLGDRRRHVAGADPGQRRGGRLAATHAELAEIDKLAPAS